MSEKPSVSETAVARRFVLHVGPRLSGGVLRNFFRRDPTGLDREAAPYEFALDLYPADQAARLGRLAENGRGALAWDRRRPVR